MPPSIAIHSRNTWLDNQLQPAAVFIENGKIQSVEKGKPDSIACPLEDLGDAVLMPGLTDAHVHINEPGRTDWEGFDTATRAAAAGGITSLVEMPLNASPVTTSPESFQKKLAATTGKLHVNCGFWGGIVPENAGQLEPLLESGVLGIKAFLTHSGIDEFPNVTEADLRKGMAAIARSGMPLLAHCELPDLTNFQNLSNLNPTHYQTWLHSRPKSWENAAIELMINLCREYGCRTHIVHLSSAEALPAIIAARREGLPLTVETCPHYLFFNAEDIPDADTRFKCAPPIRERENNEQLWGALGEGIIDFIATDHSPAPPAIKELESGNLMKAWGGIAGLQFLLPVTWTAAKRRGFTLKNLVHWLVEAPAAFAGFGDRKGKIAPGYDADLVVWHPEAGFTVEEEMIQFRHKITPYMGFELQGVVERTYVGGVKVFEKGRMVELNQGQVILA
jgi:allantoinase